MYEKNQIKNILIEFRDIFKKNTLILSVFGNSFILKITVLSTILDLSDRNVT